MSPGVGQQSVGHAEVGTLTSDPSDGYARFSGRGTPLPFPGSWASFLHAADPERCVHIPSVHVSRRARSRMMAAARPKVSSPARKPSLLQTSSVATGLSKRTGQDISPVI